MSGTWPRSTRAELDAFFGRHTLGPDGLPTQSWIDNHLVLVPTPFPLRLSWEPVTTVWRVRCHVRVAASLDRVLRAIWHHYGSLQAVRAARVDLFGGCYEYRRISGSHELSLHAYGAAVDIDPERNRRGKAWVSGTGMLPRAVIRIFEEEGWAWGGRFSNPDAMHFEAVSRGPVVSAVADDEIPELGNKVEATMNLPPFPVPNDTKDEFGSMTQLGGDLAALKNHVAAGKSFATFDGSIRRRIRHQFPEYVMWATLQRVEESYRHQHGLAPDVPVDRLAAFGEWERLYGDNSVWDDAVKELNWFALAAGVERVP